MSMESMKHAEWLAEGAIEDRRARAEAAAWMVRLYGDKRTPQLEAALRDWLVTHPRNASHFEEMTQVWELGGQTTGRGISRMRPPSGTTHSPRWPWAFAASIAIVASIGGGLGWRAWTDSRYTTGLGEQRLLRLEEGSRVTLNSNTQVHLDLTHRERRIRLERGEAFFEVARDTVRPFIVIAGNREVTALGTSFVVRYEADRTAVTLVEGKVRVAEQARIPPAEAGSRKPPQTTTLLTSGERVVFTAKEPLRIDSPRIDMVTAWRRGEVLLDNTPLNEAVAEMNRYDTRQLMIDDPELASLQVSGVYRSGDSLGFAQGVANVHGFEITEDGLEIHLRR